MSFAHGSRVHFHRVLATPPSDRQRYGAPYPSVAQLKGSGCKRTSTDLFWGERPLSSGWVGVVQAGGQNQVTANVRIASALSTASSSPLCATNNVVEASNAPNITLPAAVQQQLAKSGITSLLIPSNAKPQLISRCSFPESRGHDKVLVPQAASPFDGPPSLSGSSSSSFTASPYATTPDEDSAMPYFGLYAAAPECDIPEQAENVDASVFKHLGSQ